jgi:mRNA interferase ChpB
MVSLDPAIGREQFGHRPVLVVSKDRFNASTRLPVIVPITNGGNFARRSGFAVELIGTRTTGIVRCDQPRVVDISERKGRFVEVVPDAVLLPVLGLLQSIFDI